jgi:hypothetical protein
MLDYYLTPNVIPPGAGGWHAVVTHSEGEDTKHFVRTLGETLNINEGEAKRVIAGISAAARDLLSQGWGFKIEGVGSFSLGVSGVFPGPDAPFDPSVNKIRVHFQADKELAAAARRAPMTRLHGVEHGPVIDSVEDKESGAVNAKLSPGHGVLVIGKCLKIAGDDPSCGVRLVDEDGDETALAPKDILENGGTRLLFICPALAAGVYHLKVTTQSSDGNGSVLIKSPRSYTFAADLTVEQPQAAS